MAIKVPHGKKNDVKNIEELQDYVLSIHDRRALGELMVHLLKFQSVTTSLYKKGLSTSTVHEVFDAILDEYEYPELKTYLTADADIVNNTEFECDLNNIVGKIHLSMTHGERVATSSLLRNKTSELGEQGDAGTSSYFERIQKQKCHHLSDELERYIDCFFCVATSHFDIRMCWRVMMLCEKSCIVIHLVVLWMGFLCVIWKGLMHVS